MTCVNDTGALLKLYYDIENESKFVMYQQAETFTDI